MAEPSTGLETQNLEQGELSHLPLPAPGAVGAPSIRLASTCCETWQVADCSIKAIANCGKVCTVPKERGMSATASVFVWCVAVLVYAMESSRRDRRLLGSQGRLLGWH